MAQTNTAGHTTLGKGCSITGKLTFDGTVAIDGNVEGEITAGDTILIGESAVVDAQITADSIVITGKVTGDVTARRRLEIKAPGQVYGNVTTPSLVVHDGVTFEGRCTMSGLGAHAGVVAANGHTGDSDHTPSSWGSWSEAGT
jgi:cytoskeletal protein CcmA (bactofilin family)